MANPKTILVVDDDPGSRRLLQFVLAKTGCVIVCVSGGNDALAAAEKHAVDLLVTDYMMHGLDGLELARQIRAMPAYHALPIIILTARGHLADAPDVKRDALTHFTTKPFSPLELIARCKGLLGL